MKNKTTLPTPTKELLQASSNKDLARLLGFRTSSLCYILYKLPSRPYKKFGIPKKSKGVRIICAPRKPITTLQEKVYHLLLPLYRPKKSASAFIKNRSIVFGADKHSRKRHLVTFDLKDFFDSIHFGRVQGLLMATPFNIHPDVAQSLANIICYEDKLPQGGITSPLISNMICWKLDTQLTELAVNTGCTYTRYADDISISTWKKELPPEIGTLSKYDITLSEEVQKIVNDNGFEVNPSKTRYTHPSTRMEVTGLTVNRRPNIQRKKIRNLRALLHDWDINGYVEAEQRYRDKSSNPPREEATLEEIVCGKLAFLKMVRGENDPVYRKLKRKHLILSTGSIPTGLLDAVPTLNADSNYLFGEGQTDWKHLYAAFRYFRNQGLYNGLNLVISPPPAVWEGGFSNLKMMVERYKLLHNTNSKLFFLFDTDEQQAVKYARGRKDNSNLYHHQGSNVYTLLLSHTPNLCIEHLYPEEELKRANSAGRRLYLSNEFTEQGVLKDNSSITYCSEKKPFDKRWVHKKHILDADVIKTINGKKKNIACSKKDFSSQVLARPDTELVFTFDEFKPIFDAIEKALAAYKA